MEWTDQKLHQGMEVLEIHLKRGWMAVVEVVESLVLMVFMGGHNELHCVWPASVILRQMVVIINADSMK